MRYVTEDRNDFGKQIKCSAMNNLGNTVEYAKIPGFIISIYQIEILIVLSHRGFMKVLHTSFYSKQTITFNS